MASNNGMEAPTLQEQDTAILAMRVKSLEESLKKLAEVNQLNLRHIQNAFSMVDQHQVVLQRIANDFGRDTVRVTPVFARDQEFLDSNPPLEVERKHHWLRTEDSVIDLDWYHKQYYEAHQLFTFIAFLNHITGSADKKPESAVEEENVSYFGGDT